ncbi:MAG: hypothetical protein L6R40_004521 [Gallowayella cf. fulva]|nr:MAG: hypothetical protein L6R40_004521 [Xanthomendoza cf. fulva]
MNPQDAAAILTKHTNMSHNDAMKLVIVPGNSAFDQKDLEELVGEAYEKHIISSEVAAIAKMALMTRISLERCRELVDQIRDDETGEADTFRAMIRAKPSEVSNVLATSARLAILMDVDSVTARQYLDHTERFSIQQAISHMRHGLPCDPAVADIALFRLYTELSKNDAIRFVALAGDKGLEEAVRLAGEEQMFKNSKKLWAYSEARLRARFNLEAQQAKDCLVDIRVRGDFIRATMHFLTEQLMEETLLDYVDASQLMRKDQGNFEAARQLFLQERSTEPIVEAANADTRHPPDIGPNTRVIAVLGVSDEDDAASPANDGWMVSDFYMWKNVLSGLGKEQQWITCEYPNQLVEKYGTENKSIDYVEDGRLLHRQISWADGYVHGDPFEERRAVLDKASLAFAQQQLVIAPRGVALRNEFLRRLEATCQKAVLSGDNVLVLAFSHGEIDNVDLGGLVIGFNPKSGLRPDDYLTSQLFKISLMKTPSAKVSLFMTSCHSGHWVVTPRFRLIQPNAVMAAARPFEESWAWAQSASQRHAGGVYTSSFLNELFKDSIGPVEDLVAKVDPEDARAYDQFRRDVVTEANRLCLPKNIEIGVGSLPLFTTEGGIEPAFQRTGFGLHYFKSNFDQLRRIPASDVSPYFDRKRDAQPTDPDVIEWTKRHPETERSYSDRTGGYGSTRRGIRSSTKYMVHVYCKSHPGEREQPSNTVLHRSIDLFLAGAFNGENNLDKVLTLRSQLQYRLWAMAKANQVAKWLNLNKVPRIHDFNFKEADPKLVTNMKENYEHVHHFRLFSPPDVSAGNYGKFFNKPTQYLAYAFAASDYYPSDIRELLRRILNETVEEVTKRKVSMFHQSGSQRGKESAGKMNQILESPRKKRKTRMSLASADWANWWV